jgi:hypothetical protein
VLCASLLGSMKLVNLSVPGTFNNSGEYWMLKICLFIFVSMRSAQTCHQARLPFQVCVVGFLM